MSTKITALGTGAADAIKYYQTSFFVGDETTNLLIDTGGGSGIRTQLDRFGIALNGIQNVFITHKHIDHIFGVFWILRFRGAAIHSGKAPNLAIYASKSNIALIKQISAVFLKKKVIDLFDNKIQFTTVDDNNEISLNDWKVQFFNLESAKEEQWGCRIVFPNNKTLAFIGDEPYRDKLLPLCRDVDYLFHDAYCLERDRTSLNPDKISHSTVSEAAMNAQKAGTKNLVLFHTEDKLTFGQRKELYAAEARQGYSGNVFVPEDGETIEIG